jgi:hypothetical protein
MWHDLDMLYLEKWAVQLNVEDVLQRLFDEIRLAQS